MKTSSCTGVVLCCDAVLSLPVSCIWTRHDVSSTLLCAFNTQQSRIFNVWRFRCAGYNPFRHNVYRSSIIISGVDTIVSLVAGCTVFAILGNLRYELSQVTGKTLDFNKVIKSGPELVFVAYPQAIAKFEYCPRVRDLRRYRSQFVCSSNNFLFTAFRRAPFSDAIDTGNRECDLQRCHHIYHHSGPISKNAAVVDLSCNCRYRVFAWAPVHHTGRTSAHWFGGQVRNGIHHFRRDCDRGRSNTLQANTSFFSESLIRIWSYR